MKDMLKSVLKLLGDRLLFIIITFIFMVPITVFIKVPTHLLYYPLFAAIPYLMLLYYDMWDVGHAQADAGNKKIGYGIKVTLIWQIPTLILLILYIFTQNLVTKLIYEAYLASFLAPRTMVYLQPMLSRDIIFYIIAPIIEIAICIVAYYLGTKDFVFEKHFNKKK